MQRRQALRDDLNTRKPADHEKKRALAQVIDPARPPLDRKLGLQCGNQAVVALEFETGFEQPQGVHFVVEQREADVHHRKPDHQQRNVLLDQKKYGAGGYANQHQRQGAAEVAAGQRRERAKQQRRPREAVEAVLFGGIRRPYKGEFQRH
ncbi:MAG: hypothetical protein ACRC1G_04215 [Bradyrhizobium sp.]